jgi:FkbM family methyltransferase
MDKNIIVNILKKLRMYRIAVIVIGWMSASREQLDKRTIKQLLQKEDPVVLEIGACDGGDTERFLREFRDIRIYCFEPDPRNLAILKRSIRDDRCVIVEAAVSNKDGEAILHMSTGWPRPLPRWVQLLGLSKSYISLRGKEWTASSSIVESIPCSEDDPWLTFDRVARVKAVKLDTWVREEKHSSCRFHLDGCPRCRTAGD